MNQELNREKTHECRCELIDTLNKYNMSIMEQQLSLIETIICMCLSLDKNSENYPAGLTRSSDNFLLNFISNLTIAKLQIEEDGDSENENDENDGKSDEETQTH